jgi:predicted KAP-like P-loop ATPase
MAMVDPQSQRAFERIYEYRHAEGQWPRVDEFQRKLTGKGEDIDLRAVVTRSAAYASITSEPGVEGQQLRLLLYGLACVPAARPLLEAYLLAVQKMVEQYCDPDADPNFTDKGLGALGLDPSIERELSELLRMDNWTFGGGSSSPEGSWSYEISDRMVRQARGVETVDELLVRRFGDLPNRNDAPPASDPDPLSSVPGGSPTVDADRPISGVEEDLLERGQLARLLSAQATGQMGSGFVMGVSGPWGSGKTSLLNLMAADIRKSESGFVVRFDPWLFSSSDELVWRFMNEVSIQLQGEKRFADAARRIGEYAQILAPLSVLASAPWLAPVLAASGRAAKAWRKRPPVSAREQRDKVADALSNLDRRLVVVIDDLDRLGASEIRDVVRLVKLVGDFPNTTYVLAYDQARVARALGEGEDVEGQEFLEKIVQLTHEVPPVDPMRLGRVLAGSISAAVGDLSQYSFDQHAYTNLFADARNLFSSVRDVRRYTNVLPGTLALIGGEVELADVLALEALRVRVPASFSFMITGQQALTEPSDTPYKSDQTEREGQQHVHAIVSAAGEDHAEVTALIKRLFPSAERHLGGSHYGSDWQRKWRRERRVAHPEVFAIYLQKALPPGVLPAALVEQAFESLEDRDALSAVLNGLTSEDLESLLGRLEHYEQEFPKAHVEIPVAVLFNQHRRLQRPRRHVFDLGAEFAIPRVVLRLLRGLDASEVTRVLPLALSEIETLSDRAHLVRMVSHRENSGHQLLDEDTAKQLEAGVIDEVLAADCEHLAGEQDLLHLLFWARNERPDDTAARITQLMRDDDFVLGLLRAAVGEPVAQTMGDAAVRRSQQLDWRALTELVLEDQLSERVRELADSPLAESRDKRTRIALEHAKRYADDPDLAKQDQGT